MYFCILNVTRYNFLDKSVGVSSLCEITNNFVVDPKSQVVESRFPLHIPGVEGLLIPGNSRGHILKLVGPETALVRWEVNDSSMHYNLLLFFFIPTPSLTFCMFNRMYYNML